MKPIKSLFVKKYGWIIFLVIIIIVGYYVGAALNVSSDNAVIAPKAQVQQTQSGSSLKQYDYTEAPKHIGEYAKVSGTVINGYTSKKGTTFFDYCADYSNCPFSAVIFASDIGKFSNLSQYKTSI